jgi:hypothetical protein
VVYTELIGFGENTNNSKRDLSPRSIKMARYLKNQWVNKAHRSPEVNYIILLILKLGGGGGAERPSPEAFSQ